MGKTYCPAIWNRISMSAWTWTRDGPSCSCTNRCGRWRRRLWWTRRWCRNRGPASRPDCRARPTRPSSCRSGQTGTWRCPSQLRGRTRCVPNASSWPGFTKINHKKTLIIIIIIITIIPGRPVRKWRRLSVTQLNKTFVARLALSRRGVHVVRLQAPSYFPV